MPAPADDFAALFGAGRGDPDLNRAEVARRAQHRAEGQRLRKELEEAAAKLAATFEIPEHYADYVDGSFETSPSPRRLGKPGVEVTINSHDPAHSVRLAVLRHWGGDLLEAVHDRDYCRSMFDPQAGALHGTARHSDLTVFCHPDDEQRRLVDSAARAGAEVCVDVRTGLESGVRTTRYSGWLSGARWDEGGEVELTCVV